MSEMTNEQIAEARARAAAWRAEAAADDEAAAAADPRNRPFYEHRASSLRQMANAQERSLPPEPHE